MKVFTKRRSALFPAGGGGKVTPSSGFEKEAAIFAMKDSLTIKPMDAHHEVNAVFKLLIIFLRWEVRKV